MPALPTGTITFLFTDIEGSTRLWELYPEAMRTALARHDALLKQAIEDNKGYVFKMVGDAFCAAFSTAADALAASVQAQLLLHREEWGETGPLRVRMGLHTGQAEERDGDYFGQTLNRVARLHSAGYGQQTLLSQATYQHICHQLPPDVTLQNMGQHRLKDLLAPEHVWQLHHPEIPSEFPPLKSLDYLPTNLPRQMTSFIGREREMGEVKRLLPSTNLLTLLGSGGCGKTRLALQVGADVLEDYKDGVWLVELAALSDPELVPQTIAGALGLREEAGRPLLQTLQGYLQDRQLLLLLDNCEHLLSACAHLANTLLRNCSHLTILATSREPLGIAGERHWRVPSLLMPAPEDLPEKEKDFSAVVMAYDACRLFAERAVVQRQDFVLTRSNMPIVADLCHQLDGIPLAIELAAARVRSLSVEEINSKLDNRFRLLTGGSKTALPRQQTLRALIDWSYDLLNEQERIMLGRLAVFAGGWTLEAAEQVCSEEGIEDWEVLDLLTSLVDKSLVIAEERESATRYRMLETVRQYANERLQSQGETVQIKTRHRDTFLALAEESVQKWKGAEQQLWLERLQSEYDNLHSALAWCFEEEKGAEAGLRLAGALFWFWELRGHLNAGRMYLQQALNREEAQDKTAIRAQALIGAGNLAFSQSDYVVAHELQEEALLILRELEDWKGVAMVLNALGNTTSDQGNYTEARWFYEEALAIYRRLDNVQGLSIVLNNVAILEHEQGNYEKARLLNEESLEILRKLGDMHGISRSLGNLAMVVSDQGHYAQSFTLQEEALAIKRALGDKNGIARSLNHLGNVVHMQGNVLHARDLQAEALAIQRDLGDKRGIADSLYNLAKYADQRGDHTEARSHFRECLLIRREIEDRLGICDALELWVEMLLPLNQTQKVVPLCGCAHGLREALGAPLSPQDREKYDRQIAQIRSTMEEDTFTALWEEGRAISWEQAVAYALE